MVHHLKRLLANLGLDNGIGAAILPHPVGHHDKPQLRFLRLLAYRLKDALGKHAHGSVDAQVRLVEIEMFVDLGVRYGEREQGFGIPARAEHGLESRKRRTAQERRCVKDGALHPFHPALKALDAGFGADHARLDPIRLAFVERPEQGQAVARVLHRLTVPEQQRRLRNVNEVFHCSPPSGAPSSKASSSRESRP